MTFYRPNKPQPLPTPAQIDLGASETSLQGEKWIDKAIKNPGSLHRKTGTPEGEKIPAKKLAKLKKKAKKKGDTKTLKQLALAKTLKKVSSEAVEHRKRSTT